VWRGAGGRLMVPVGLAFTVFAGSSCPQLIARRSARTGSHPCAAQSRGRCVQSRENRYVRYQSAAASAREALACLERAEAARLGRAARARAGRAVPARDWHSRADLPANGVERLGAGSAGARRDSVRSTAATFRAHGSLSEPMGGGIRGTVSPCIDVAEIALPVWRPSVSSTGATRRSAVPHRRCVCRALH
jgi:hypothetical protein